MVLYNSKNIAISNINIKKPLPIVESVKNGLKDLDFNPLKNQLKKIAQLILETLQSDLK